VSIQIMQAFVKMKMIISINAGIFQRLEMIELTQIEGAQKFEKIFKALENKSIKPKQGIFYQGQIFDAYVFVSNLIKSANKSILLIDNYIDETILQLFTKRNKNVSVTIFTKNISKILKQDLAKHNNQYPAIEIKQFSKAHDRFLIIDDTTVYHIGASLKDLGKQCFAFSRMDTEAIHLIGNL
ncbi:MAG: ORF6N domain-containing protein, partial [Candidatus Marinimicrobia bacterium]|nr:ORF6N domain-containing protein [Candidatus Neomarinimicrobiota bacterium]